MTFGFLIIIFIIIRHTKILCPFSYEATLWKIESISKLGCAVCFKGWWLPINYLNNVLGKKKHCDPSDGQVYITRNCCFVFLRLGMCNIWLRPENFSINKRSKHANLLGHFLGLKRTYFFKDFQHFLHSKSEINMFVSNKPFHSDSTVS